MCGWGVGRVRKGWSKGRWGWEGPCLARRGWNVGRAGGGSTRSPGAGLPVESDAAAQSCTLLTFPPRVPAHTSIRNNWGYIFSPTINWFPWLCFSQWKKIILVIQSSLSSLLVAVIICSALPISQRVRSMQSRRRRWIRQRGAARCSTFKNLFPFHIKCFARHLTHIEKVP